MYCKNCGEQIKENAKFCVFCGTKIDEVENKTIVNIEEEIINDNKVDIFDKDEADDLAEFKTLEDMEELEDSECIEEDVVIPGEIEELPEELSLLEKIENEETEVEVVEETKEETTSVKEQPIIEEIISFIFGITSLVLAVFINIFALPMSASGLVFGSYGKAKSGKKVSFGRCINIVSIIVSLSMFFVCMCGLFGMMSSIQNELITPERFDYQYQLNTNINEREDRQAIEDWQKALEMLNKQEEAKRELEKKKEIEEKEKVEKQETKYTNIGYMEYSIPDTWTFNGIRESGGNAVANVFSKNNDTAFLAIKAVDLTNAEFNKDMLKAEVSQMYGGIAEEGNFSTNNDITWEYIKTPTYDGENMKYFNNIYYHLTEDGNALLYFEIYVPDNGTTEELMTDIDTILNSVRKFK